VLSEILTQIVTICPVLIKPCRDTIKEQKNFKGASISAFIAGFQDRIVLVEAS
jgi:hypothetical protein